MSQPLGSAHTVSDFDARAANWDDDPVKVERARAVADAILDALHDARGARRALEYGAGTGLLSFMLRERFDDITLADVSEGMLAVARDKIAAAKDTRVRAVKLDLLADALPAQRYDVVYSLMTLHHIPDTAGILRRFRAVLDAGGHLCVADLDREDGSFHGAGFDGHNGFDRAALQRLAEQAGFTQVRFATAYEMRKETAGQARSYPVFLMIAEAA